MTNTLQGVTPDVDALDVDAPAAAQLAKDVPNASVVRTDGCTYICFTDRDDFLAACGERVIEITNPFDIKTQGRNVYAPVLFGKDGQWRWEAMAVFPAQNPCDCGAEVTHQLGCSSIEYPDASMFAESSRIDPNRCPSCDSPSPRLHPSTAPEGGEVYAICPDPFHIEVVVVDIPGGPPRAGRDDADRLAALDGYLAVLPRRIPGAAIVHYRRASGWNACGAQRSNADTHFPNAVTCPDCAAVPPLTAMLRDAYSPDRAAEVAELASEVAK